MACKEKATYPDIGSLTYIISHTQIQAGRWGRGRLSNWERRPWALSGQPGRQPNCEVKALNENKSSSS